MGEPMGYLLEELIGSGVIPDVDKARRRLKLAYPSWLILDDLQTERVTAVLSRVSSIPVLGKPLTSDLLEVGSPEFPDPTVLKTRRWAPLTDGRIAVADPFGPLPAKDSAGGNCLCLAPAREIDRALGTAFPAEESGPRGSRRLGRLLLDGHRISEKDLARALDEQQRSGGRLGEILRANNAVDASTLTEALADKLGLPTLRAEDKPEPLLPADRARVWRAVVLSEDSGAVGTRTPLSVAFSDPSATTVDAVRDYLQSPVQPKLTDPETLT